jgi:hypothetical protein
MPASKVQLIGGKFQDGEGNVLALGYLTMKLSQDGTVAGVGEICAGITIKILLDSNGSVVASPAQSVWGNDVLLPVNSYYKVTGFSAQGQPAWGPNVQQVVGGPTFDVGTWIPNQVISWVNPITGSQAIVLQVNGVSTINQLLANFIAGTNITLSSNAFGGITINAASGGGALNTPGQGYFYGPGFGLTPTYGSGVSSGVTGVTPNQVTVFQFVMPYSVTISRVSIDVVSAQAGQTVNFGIYSAAKAKLLDSGALSLASLGNVSNVITPVTLTANTVYYFAQSQTSSSPTVRMANAPAVSVVAELNAVNVKVGQSPNLTVGGVMPASLGVLVADTLDLNVGMPLFEV